MNEHLTMSMFATREDLEKAKLEQKIEAEATKYACEYMELNYSYVPFMVVAKDTAKDAFKAAALPLHKEIESLKRDINLETYFSMGEEIKDLRDALDELTAPFTSELNMDDLAEHNLEIREKFKLDAPTKARK